MLNPDFNRLLWQRNMTVAMIAKLITCSEKGVTMVLGGLRPGTPTWKKLAGVLTKDEYDMARAFALARAARRGKEVEPPYKPEAVSDSH